MLLHRGQRLSRRTAQRDGEKRKILKECETMSHNPQTRVIELCVRFCNYVLDWTRTGEFPAFSLLTTGYGASETSRRDPVKSAYGGKSGKHVLILSLTTFAPKRSFEASTRPAYRP
jgi:hypothetical protein